MTRNPNTRNETRYTPTNPPDSEEAAQAQIGRLKNDIASIEHDLEHQTVHSFDDQEDFEVWKRRATSAIKYKKREVRFLDAWLKARESEKQEAAQAQALQELNSRIAALADSYEQAYSPVFGLHHPAEDVEEARSRFSHILAIQSQMDTDLAQVRESTSLDGIKNRERLEIEQPLRSIAHRINTEVQYLRNLLRILAPETDVFREEDRAQSEQEIAIAQRAEELANAISEERPSPYDAEHPPTGIGEAKERLKLLAKIRRRVQEASKELGDEWQETAISGLPKWTKRPLSQLHTSVDAESAFLNEYIRGCNREAERKLQEARREAKEKVGAGAQDERRASRSELSDISQRICDQASKLAREIDESYTKVYTGEQPPQSIEEAEQQLAHVLAVKSSLQSAFSEITEAWCTHPLRRGDLPLVKKPLVEILLRVETEMRTIKSFLKQQGAAKMPKHLYWKSVCIAALMRASFEGFKLTEEEQEVVKVLLEEVSAASSI
jgi:hypothetical protein